LRVVVVVDQTVAVALALVGSALAQGWLLVLALATP
jgi:hypothetical protein